eukprot:TRINITY_DN12234_c1_g1_i1.p1 TRINITY_DN12234_c1_g1~~TRINITY_DN12234_c1_g1_i1.p1  ORF type:complete len:133 (+),score=6.53 TRINITY_DN12234_c1_g1_i1:55-399(+)
MLIFIFIFLYWSGENFIPVTNTLISFSSLIPFPPLFFIVCGDFWRRQGNGMQKRKKKVNVNRSFVKHTSQSQEVNKILASKAVFHIHLLDHLPFFFRKGLYYSCLKPELVGGVR